MASAAKETCEDGADTAASEVCPSFYTAVEVLPSSEGPAAVEATDVKPASTSGNQYYSARTQWMIENRDKYTSRVDFEIECSKVHRTSVQRGGIFVQEGNGSDCSEDEEEDERELDEEILQANRETITELRKHPLWRPRFVEEGDGVYEIGEKIGEGGQATIYAGIRTDVKEGDWERHVVLKVFGRGYYLRDLVNQWPDCSAWYPIFLLNSSRVEHVRLLPNDGRIAIVMRRQWGDLRRLIDLKKQANHNQGPPFDINTTVVLMCYVASFMDGLHRRDVVHRDLKASNVLMEASSDSHTAWESNAVDIESHVPKEHARPVVSDWECALGVMGTGFWRAPEVLLGTRDPIKRRCPTSLFTKASDVYSYGMLCYEIATGFLPFEREGFTEAKVYQDRVISGGRPTFPDDVDCRVKDLISRCWQHNANARPTFQGIKEELFSCFNLSSGSFSYEITSTCLPLKRKCSV